MKANQKRKPRKTRSRTGKTASTLNNTLPEWHNLPAKRRAFLTIMRNIIDDPDLGQTYLESDADAAQAFRDAGLQVPPDIKVVFLPAGDTEKMPLGAGSAIIQLPHRTSAQLTDQQLLDLFTCTYHLVW